VQTDNNCAELQVK